MITLEILIGAAGLKPNTRWAEWNQLLELGTAIEKSIQDPIAMVEFIAEAAVNMSEINPADLKGMNFLGLIEAASAARPTTWGCTELWGTAMQEV